MVENREYIGMATMTEDGTIILDLEADIPGGGRGIGRLTYPRSHAQYQDILSHIGAMLPGDQKLVRPWENEGAQTTQAPEPSPAANLKCSSCQAMNPPGSRFCNQCASRLIS